MNIAVRALELHKPLSDPLFIYYGILVIVADCIVKEPLKHCKQVNENGFFGTDYEKFNDMIRVDARRNECDKMIFIPKRKISKEFVEISKIQNEIVNINSTMVEWYDWIKSDLTIT